MRRGRPVGDEPRVGRGQTGGRRVPEVHQVHMKVSRRAGASLLVHLKNENIVKEFNIFLLVISEIGTVVLNRFMKEEAPPSMECIKINMLFRRLSFLLKT